MLIIRRAVKADLPYINTILNACIKGSVNNLAIICRTDLEAIEWFNDHGDHYPVFVAVKDNEILGWASLSVFRNNQGYYPTVENSVYVKDEVRGCGIGKQLLKTLIKAGRDLEYHTIIALITEENEASIYLHKSLGFIITGNMIEVGVKFGKMSNVTIMQFFLENQEQNIPKYRYANVVHEIAIDYNIMNKMDNRNKA